MKSRVIFSRLLACVFLLLVFVFTAFMVVSKGEEISDQEAIHFVLVVDESRTMNDSDSSDYCRAAINMFVDMLPVEDVDVGMVGFGRKNAETAYDYTVLEPVKGHEQYVRQIHPFVNLSDSAAKDDLKNSVNTIEWEGSQTLIDAGLLAGLDMLSVSGAPDDKGCVIMLTDGEYKALAETGRNDTVMNSKAAAYANEHGWQVYCVELDYANAADKRNAAYRYLTSQITDKCQGDTYPVDTAEGVSIALMKIINSFYQSGVMDEFTADGKGYHHHTVEVPDLTSEANITIASDSMKGIKLTNGDVEVSIGDYNNDGKDETSYNQSDFIVSRGKGYCNIKMILPKVGTWNVDVLAAANSAVMVNSIPFSDLNIRFDMIPNGNTEDTPLTKEDQIAGNIFLDYRGQSIRRRSLGGAKACLHVVNEITGEACPDVEMLWNDRENRFEGMVKVADLGKMGKLSVWIELAYANGERRACAPVTVYTERQRIELISGANIYIERYVRKRSEPIEISGLFENPDQSDPCFRIRCEDEDVSIASNDENTAIMVETGSRVGEYDIEFFVWDADLGEDHAIQVPFTLNVLNHQMETKAIPDQDIVKKAGNERTTLDLNAYFFDEDQLYIQYKAVSSDGSILVCSVTEQGKLNMTAKGKGKAEVTVSAVDDDGTEYRESFTVEVIPRINSVMRQIIAAAGRGILFVIGAGTMAAVFLISRGNIRIRGVWYLEFVYRGISQNLELDMDGKLTGKERHKTTIWKLIEGEDIARSNIRMAEAELDQIILKGVRKKAGCKLQSRVDKVRINGQELRKADLSVGTTKLSVPVGSDTLTITIKIEKQIFDE